jgi:OmpA-OmpF porin, OOP family
MKMKLVLFSLTAIIFMFSGYGQENLVVNGSFDQVGKVKKKGQIDLADGWTSLTGAGADVFTSKAPEGVKPEDNYMGKEEPYEGSNMAGIMVFSPKNRLPRQYLSNKLTMPLKKNQAYCVSFRLSLAEASKIACNNIGINVSKRQPTLDTKGILQEETHVKHVDNQLMKGTYNWDVICAIYVAEGGEKFINIGNFASESETKFEKVKLMDKSVTQIGGAYYYIDEVSVVAIESNDECDCYDITKAGGASTVYSPPAIINSVEFDLDDWSDHVTQYFPHGKYKTSTNGGMNNLDSLAQFMLINSGTTVTVYGNSDQSEEDMSLEDDSFLNLGLKRNKSVVDYLVSKGVSKARIKQVNNRAGSPASEENNDTALAKNRRVEIKFNM